MALAKDIQDELVGHLATLAPLQGVPIVGRRRLSIANDIEAAVAQLGACLYVMPALPVRVNPNSPGPYIDQLEIRVRAIEMPAVNTTLPDVFELVEHVLRALHHHTLVATPGGNPLVADATPVRDVEDPAGEAVIMDVILSVSTGYVPAT